jgi:hypothetical protein
MWTDYFATHCFSRNSRKQMVNITFKKIWLFRLTRISTSQTEWALIGDQLAGTMRIKDQDSFK